MYQYNDYITPQISFEDIGGVYNYGEQATIRKAIMSDVLTPVLDGSIGLRIMLGKEIIRDIDEVLLDGQALADKDYTISLSRYGQYLVTYSPINRTDTIVSKPLQTSIIVQDSQAPDLRVEDTKPVTIKLGETHAIKKYSVADNETPVEKIKVMIVVMDAQNCMVQRGSSDTFKPTFKGNYTIYIYAYDEAFNYTIVEYELRVK